METFLCFLLWACFILSKCLLQAQLRTKKNHHLTVKGTARQLCEEIDKEEFDNCPMGP